MFHFISLGFPLGGEPKCDTGDQFEPPLNDHRCCDRQELPIVTAQLTDRALKRKRRKQDFLVAKIHNNGAVTGVCASYVSFQH